MVADPTVPARVRVEVLREQRHDVDALAFIAGPGRLHIVAAHPGRGLSFLNEVDGLVADIENGMQVAGSISSPRADLSWKPDETPSSMRALLGDDVVGGSGSFHIGAEARIEHDPGQRIAKGLDSSRLASEDRQILHDALSTEPARGQTRDPDSVGASARVGSPASKPHQPALKNPLQLLPNHEPAQPPMEDPER